MTRKSFFKLLISGVSSFFLFKKTSISFAQTATITEDFPPFIPPEGVNKPLGIPAGIMPGRVVWAYDPKAALWNEASGHWWDAGSNDQARIHTMLSKAIREIANKETDKKAWDSIFKYFNSINGKENIGYAEGEKIAIKINLNNDRSNYDDTPWINTSPQVVHAALHGLVSAVGVKEEDITIFDATRYITPHFYNYVHNAFPNVKFVDGYGGVPGRTKTAWTPNRINYALKTQCGSSIATCAVEASYLINIYVAKGHPSTGVTLSGKNHYGSIDGREHSYINVKTKGYGQYNPLVELMGHKDLGGKTILNICDMLYGCYHSDALPIKWKMAPFHDAWPSSLLVSQDPVANDSVALDFLTTEFSPRKDIPFGVNTKGKKISMANCDALLHEAAQAGNPPSQTFYAPNGDGMRPKSLGVHEHWNNSKDKKYSRNLGQLNGIELVIVDQLDNIK